MGRVSGASLEQLQGIAKKVRQEIVEMIYQAGSGHPGGSLSSTDLLVALYFGGVADLEACPQRQSRSAGRGGRDKFILSAGHVCPAWYSVINYKLQITRPPCFARRPRTASPLAEQSEAARGTVGLARRSGQANYKLGDLRKLGSVLQGHPYKKMADFVETSTGSLGQGISVGVGMALGKKIKKENETVWVLSSDGEQEEGQVWEAAMFSAKENLNNLCLLIDRNGMQIGGETEKITKLEPLKEKYKAFGWQVTETDGHDFEQILAAYEIAKKVRTAPLVIIAKTVRGKGISFMENQERYHACTLTEEEYKKAMEELK